MGYKEKSKCKKNEITYKNNNIASQNYTNPFGKKEVISLTDPTRILELPS